jgi:acetyl-CoA acetyltransferase
VTDRAALVCAPERRDKEMSKSEFRLTGVVDILALPRVNCGCRQLKRSALGKATLTGPIDATQQWLRRNNLTMDDIDVVEINEAFRLGDHRLGA